jgi:hypothetical protein
MLLQRIVWVTPFVSRLQALLCACMIAVDSSAARAATHTVRPSTDRHTSPRVPRCDTAVYATNARKARAIAVPMMALDMVAKLAGRHLGRANALGVD